MSRSIRIILADDHKIIRDGIKSLLQENARYELVAEAANGEEVMKLLTYIETDLVILDINMPKRDGLQTTRFIKEKYPETKVLVLSMLNEEEHIKQMMAAGASGYILKNSGRDELFAAINLIMKGEMYFSEEVTRVVMQGLSGNNKEKAFNSGHGANLSKREMEVLALIVKEKTNQEIADELFISIRTVDAHRRKLLEKTGARNTAGLVRFAYVNHLISS